MHSINERSMDPRNQCSWNNPIRLVRRSLSTHHPWWSGVLVGWPPDWGDMGTDRHTSPRAPSQTNSRGSPAYTGTEDTEINAHYVYSSPNTWNIYHTETLFQPKRDGAGRCYQSPKSIFVDDAGGTYFLLHDLVLLEVPNNPLTTSFFSHTHHDTHKTHAQARTITNTPKIALFFSFYNFIAVGVNVFLLVSPPEMYCWFFDKVTAARYQMRSCWNRDKERTYIMMGCYLLLPWEMSIAFCHSLLAKCKTQNGVSLI